MRRAYVHSMSVPLSGTAESSSVLICRKAVDKCLTVRQVDRRSCNTGSLPARSIFQYNRSKIRFRSKGVYEGAGLKIAGVGFEPRAYRRLVRCVSKLLPARCISHIPVRLDHAVSRAKVGASMHATWRSAPVPPPLPRSAPLHDGVSSHRWTRSSLVWKDPYCADCRLYKRACFEVSLDRSLRTAILCRAKRGCVVMSVVEGA